VETRLWVWQSAAFTADINFLRLGIFVVPAVLLVLLRRMN
jgi:hypothetical protein